MDFSTLNEFILAFLIGVTQGATEFLPISSTAHVRLVSALITQGRDIGLSSSNIIQLGTLGAVLQYFWRDLSRFLGRLKEITFDSPAREQFIQTAQTWLRGEKNFSGEAEKIGLDITLVQLGVGTVPIIVLALLFNNFAASSRSLEVIALYLLAGSVLMGFGEFAHRKTSQNSEIQANQTIHLSIGEVLLVGLFQALAIFPGISRSGATIAGALMLGRPRPEAVRFSFLLSIPAILLAGTRDTLVYLQNFFFNPTLVPAASNWTPTFITLSFFTLLVAIGTAYFSGFRCLQWLLKYLAKHPVNNFIYYRLALAFVILLLGAAQVV